MNRGRLSLLVLLASLISFVNLAQPSNVDVPASLKKWYGWVVHHHPELNCSQESEQQSRLCQWQSPLTVKVLGKQIHFEQAVTMQKQGWVQLPGAIGVWPRSVELNGQSGKVVPQNNHPAVFVKAGQYQIKGRITLDQIPLRLDLPELFTFVDLYIEGKKIPQPSIDNRSLLLNQTKPSPAKSSDALKMQVFRLIRDGNPLWLETRVELNVSGAPRVEKLGRALPQGFELTHIKSRLALRVDESGDMEVALAAGQHVISLTARLKDNIAGGKAALFQVEAKKTWPTQEIWSFVPDRRFRLLEVKGAVIDGSQTNMPLRWQQYTSYLLQADQGLGITQKRRGDSEPDKHKLTLARTLWLNFDGSQFTSQETLSGSLGYLDRLSAQSGYSAGRVSINHQGALITTVNGDQGIEVLPGPIKLTSLGQQSQQDQHMSVNPWSTQVNEALMTLNLPPGYTLFSANGADTVSHSYVASWDLWKIFIVILFVVVLANQYGAMASAVGLLYALTVHNVPEAPQVLVLLLVLGMHFVVKLLGQNKLKTIMTRLYQGALILIALNFLPFAVDQARLAIYPQLEKPYQILKPTPPVEQLDFMQQDDNSVAEQKGANLEPSKGQRARRLLHKPGIKLAEGLQYFEGKADFANTNRTPYQQYQDGVMVQTGPGKPAWRWNVVNIGWSGPLVVGQQLDLIITPPWINRSLNAVRILLFILLGYLLFNKPAMFGTKISARAGKLGLMGLPGALGLMLGMAYMVPAPVYANNYPSQAMLDEYYQRLNQPALCTPTCFSYHGVELKASPDQILLAMEIVTLSQVAVPLPIDIAAITSVKVTVDQQPAKQLTQHKRAAYVLLEPGVHQVNIAIDARALQQVNLQFPQLVGFARYDGDGWQVSGIDKQSVASRRIHLTKKQKKSTLDEQQRLTPTPIHALAKVIRTINLGLDWTVTTQVTRIAPTRGAMSLRIPLLAGEAVTTAKVKVKDGQVVVDFGQNTSSISWQSVLEKNSPLQLSAANSPDYVEVWKLIPSLIWHISYHGLDPIKGDGRGASLTWWPLGQDALSVSVARPKPLSGVSNTLDGVTLDYQPGKRVTNTRLTLAFRSSQGSDYALAIPQDANITAITNNGRSIIFAQEDGKVLLPLPPGKSKFVIQWRQDKSFEWISSTPALTLPKAANIAITTSLPGNRWVLGVAGPLIGPAVLFWGVLLLILAISFALGRQAWSPLKSWQWALMGTGIATSFWPTTLLVVIWFVAISHRHLLINAQTQIKTFRLVQSMIALLTLIMLIALVSSVAKSLMFGFADMQIVGNGSSATRLNWYQDVIDTQLPTTSVLSVPMWSYQLLMLLWSIWLSTSLMKWLRWGWQRFSEHGLWKNPAEMPASKTTVKTAEKAVDKVASKDQGGL